MVARALTDEEFAAAWEACNGSPQAVMAATGLKERSVYKRRAAMAERGTVLHTADWTPGTIGNPARRWSPLAMTPAHRFHLEVRDGVVLVFSDAHYWPNLVSVSHRALLVLIEELRPVTIIANGDLFDGASISRHPRKGWEQRPTVAQELEACEERTGEIETAADKIGCKDLIWNLGNHDARFESHLSANVPGFEGVPGTTLPERFPRWQFSVSTVINAGSDHPVVCKHQYHQGVHAAYNNTLKAGVSMVTSHLHRLTVATWGDYRGRRYGIDTGCLANPFGPQFTYTEDAPSPHGEGFAVLTFKDGRLQPPELVEVVDGVAVFRGAEIA
jgi:hypothetical protein